MSAAKFKFRMRAGELDLMVYGWHDLHDEVCDLFFEGETWLGDEELLVPLSGGQAERMIR